MKTFFKIILIIVIVILIIIISKNRSRIVAWFGPKDSTPAANTVENNNGNSNAAVNINDLQVSNPSGAYMYYQSLSPASGGMIYGKSNVLVPYGTKMKLINTFQTNLSTQPFGGFYETDYKQYGPKSGFFDIKDISKS